MRLGTRKIIPMAAIARLQCRSGRKKSVEDGTLGKAPGRSNFGSTTITAKNQFAMAPMLNPNTRAPTFHQPLVEVMSSCSRRSELTPTQTRNPKTRNTSPKGPQRRQMTMIMAQVLCKGLKVSICSDPVGITSRPSVSSAPTHTLVWSLNLGNGPDCGIFSCGHLTRPFEFSGHLESMLFPLMFLNPAGHDPVRGVPGNLRASGRIVGNVAGLSA
jgi:hypothetical protein